MRTIAIINQKGGVGKTTTVVNMAAILAKDYKQRVLVIDADSQGNATEFLGGYSDDKGVADLLREAELGTTDVVEEYIHRTDLDGIDLIPADETLMDLDLTKVQQHSVQANVLRDVRACLETDGGDPYGWCLIDCPPAFNAASTAALLAADEVIIPIKLDAFSLRGMVNLLHQIEVMRRVNSELRLLGCLPTLFYPSEHSLDAGQALRDRGLPVFLPIRRTDKVDEMTYAQEPLVTFSPRSAAGVDYRRFVRRLVKGGNVNE